MDLVSKKRKVLEINVKTQNLKTPIQHRRGGVETSSWVEKRGRGNPMSPWVEA